MSDFFVFRNIGIANLDNSFAVMLRNEASIWDSSLRSEWRIVFQFAMPKYIDQQKEFHMSQKNNNNVMIVCVLYNCCFVSWKYLT
jgi:hypothetical protein